MSLKTLSLGGVEFIENPTDLQYVTVRTGPGDNDWANVLLDDFRTYMTVVVNQRIDTLSGEIGGGNGPSIWPSMRTLTLSGVVSGSVSFDGSADFTLNATMPDGALTIAKTSGLQTALNNINTALSGKLDTTGNAASASRLATARQIALTGIVAGSVNFDGSANVSLATTMADATLTIAKTSGLQAALDERPVIGSNARFNTLGVGADMDVLFYEDPNEANSGFIRSGTTGAYKYFNFNLNGDLNVLSGTVTVGGAKNPVWHAGNLNPATLGYLAGAASQYNSGGGANVNTFTVGSKSLVHSTGNSNVPSTSSTFWYIETLQAGPDTNTIIQHAYGTSNDELYVRRCNAGAWGNWRRVWNSANFDPTSKLDSNAVAASSTKLQTARTISLSGAVTGSGSFDGTANLDIVASVPDNALTIAKTSGLQAALDALASKVNPIFTGTVTLAGDMLPDADNIRSLGSPTLMWKDVYIGPGSLYINGQKVLEDNSGTIRMLADPNQNISIQTSGSGDVELAPTGTGVIQLKGTVSFLGGSKIRSSNGTALLFDEDVQFSSGVGLIGTPTVNGNLIHHSGNQLLLGTTQEAARTALGLGVLSTIGAGSASHFVRGDGSMGNTLSNGLSLTAATTESRGLEIGVGRTGDGSAYVDLIGDSTYTDYGLRLIRSAGAGGTSNLIHRGVGSLYIESNDGGAMVLRQNTINRLGVSSNGNIIGAQQRDALPATTTAPAWVKIGSQTWTTTGSRLLKFTTVSGNYGSRRTSTDQVTVSCRGISSATTALTQALVDQMVEHVRTGLSDSYGDGVQVGLVLTPDGAGGFNGIDIYLRIGLYNSSMPVFLHHDLNSGYVRDFTSLPTEPTGIVYSTVRKAVVDDGTGVTANKLATARNIYVQGAVSGGAAFDGTADINIMTTIGDATLTIAKTSGLQAALDGKAATNHTHAAALSAMLDNTWANIPLGLSHSSGTTENGLPVPYAAVFTMNASTNRVAQMAIGSQSGEFYWRGHREADGGWQTWRRMWHDGNFNPANKWDLTAAQNAGLEVTAGFTVTDFDTAADRARFFRGINTTANRPADYTAGMTLYYDGTGSVQVAGRVGNGDGLYFRRKTSSAWQPWRTIFHDGNIGTVADASFTIAKTSGLQTILDNAMTQGVSIPDAADLNTYLTTGWYRQGLTAQAGTGTNYPVPIAGLLVVYSQGNMTWQEYTTYFGGSKYRRSYYSSSGWSPWYEVWDSRNFDPTSPTFAGTVSSVSAGINPYFLAKRTNSTINAIYASETTNGTIYFGQGRAGYFAVGGVAADLSQAANRWFELSGAGATFSSSISVNSTNSEAQLNLTPAGGGRAIRILSNTSPNTGIYDATNSAWLFRIDGSNNAELAGSLSLPGSGSLSMGSNTRQMLNLYGTSYGIGVQSSTLYFRTGGAAASGGGFAWHRAGAHATGVADPGTGGTLLAQLLPEGHFRTLGEVQSTSANAFRMVQGSYGVFLRQDGSSTYFLMTAANDQYGGWNSLRPLTISNGTGNVSMGHNLDVSGAVTGGRVVAGTWDPGVAGSVCATGWFRASGNTGLYCDNYGGGIYMIDTTYVRTYNGKQMAAADFVISSDKRLKKDIRPFEFRGRLRPVMFSMIETDVPDIGFIADDVKRLYPEAVGEYKKDGGLLDGKMVKQLSQAKLTAVVSYQVNRAEDNIEKLEKSNKKLVTENGKLKTEVKSLNARLARLEKQVAKLAA